MKDAPLIQLRFDALQFFDGAHSERNVVQSDILFIVWRSLVNGWRKKQSRIAHHVHDVSICFEGLAQEYGVEEFRSLHIAHSKDQVIYNSWLPHSRRAYQSRVFLQKMSSAQAVRALIGKSEDADFPNRSQLLTTV
jgi:hypothetical protein